MSATVKNNNHIITYQTTDEQYEIYCKYVRYYITLRSIAADNEMIDLVQALCGDVTNLRMIHLKLYKTYLPEL